MRPVLCCLVAVLTWSGTASAAPIVYGSSSPLSDNVLATGTITQATNYNDPDSAVYFHFYAEVGSNVQVTVRRLTDDLDPALWVHQGLYIDTAQFGGSLFNNYLELGDDELDANIPGPSGDPRVSFVAPVSGFYTASVVSSVSEGTPPYDFNIVATGVGAVSSATPEPATLAVFGLMGVAGVGYVRRCRKPALA